MTPKTKTLIDGNSKRSNNPASGLNPPPISSFLPAECDKTYIEGYQQALSDYALSALLLKVQELTTGECSSSRASINPSETSLIAALLVERLVNNLEPTLVEAYSNAITEGNQQFIPEPTDCEFPQSISLPDGFPDSAKQPQFLYGDRLRYIPQDGEIYTDNGIVIGRYYAYASHRTAWMWRYILWLAEDSCSADWLKATAVWEDDLEPLPSQEASCG